MRDLLNLVFEYRSLLARRDMFANNAESRLDALARLFGPNDSSTRRRHARCDVRVPASVRVRGRTQPVNVVNLGGGGLCVEPAPQVKPGDKAVIRIVSPDQSRIYQFQVQTSWVKRSGSRTAAGMPFIGVPRALPLTGQIQVPRRRAQSA